VIPRLSAAALFAVLAACRPPAPPPPVAPPAPRPASTAPPAAVARPAVKAGMVTAMDVTTLFPRQQAGTVLVYDARPGFVAGFGRIPGAVSWPKNDFDARLSRSEEEIRAARAAGRPVVVYCTDAACPDAAAVARRLAARGHDVSVLTGGFAEWKAAGLPTE
jgi:rhodanese-related sulfurtransferase